MLKINNLSESQKKWLAGGVAGFLLLFMFLLALFSSNGIFTIPGDSGTVDEIAHIPSGYTYIKDLDFRLNPEHPPLAKALAGLPLVLAKIQGPENDWSWPGINQWEAGWYMLYRSSNDPARVLTLARIPMMLLMIGLGFFLFKWARELYGRKVGLMVLILFTFYPDVLAHGRLVTTDVAAAFGYVITLYYFQKALEQKNNKSIFFASLAFALAQLLKFSSFLLFGVLLLLVILKSYFEREKGFWFKFFSYFKIYLAVSALSLVVVWLVYIPFTLKTPVGIEHEVIERNLTSDARTLPLRNFLHLFENNPLSRAFGHYLLGIMLVIGRVEGGNATFLLGQVAEKSIRSFFPLAWLVKTPLPIIILTLWSLALVILNMLRKWKSWQAWVLLAPVLIYWTFTLKGSLNIGIRHLLPTIPFVLLIIGYTIHRSLCSKWKMAFIWSLIAVEIFHTLLYFPSYIAYFNQAVPKEKRYQYLVDSSLDWGQDLLRLKKYVEDNKISAIKIDYFGGSVPSYYIRQSSEWHSSYGPTTGWLAVSATYYQSSKLYGRRESKWSYEWLDDIRPEAIIGGSILVYNITPEALTKHPPTPSYEIKKIDPPGSLDIEKRKAAL